MSNIKDKNGNLITNEEKIMKIWREYFEGLPYTATQNTEEEAQVNEDEIQNVEPATEKESKEVMKTIKR